MREIRARNTTANAVDGETDDFDQGVIRARQQTHNGERRKISFWLKVNTGVD